MTIDRLLMIVGGTDAFVGRQRERRRIDDLLARPAVRLITLVGPGGIGKTRLAAETVRGDRLTAGPDIEWVALSRLPHDADAGAVADEVARTVATPGMAGRSSWDVLVAAFGGDGSSRRSLLVLDNCEHVLAGAGSFVADLVEALPAVTVLATSREPLGWIDEHVVEVPPLLPAHARKLFRQRAELTGRAMPDEQDWPTRVDQICRRVDNNPLFIRLAAARLRYRPLSHVLGELTGQAGDDRRMNWDSGVRGTREARHRSVGDVIAWSYRLCTAEERLLLERLSVFASGSEVSGGRGQPQGVDVEAVTGVCADDLLPADRVEMMLERLVERSLVSVHITTTSVRYYLLESIRLFARDRLDDVPGAGAAARVRGRHRRYYRDRVIACQALWFSSGEQRWLEWMRSAWDDILLGIETALEDPSEAVIGLELASALMSLRVPFIVGASRTITAHTERALEVTRDTVELPVSLRISATASLGWIALWQGRHQYTLELLDRCVSACVPDPASAAGWHSNAGADIGLPAPVEFTLGLHLLMMEQDPRAIAVFSRARAKFARMGDKAGEERSELFVVLATCVVGDGRVALREAHRHLVRTRAMEAGWANWWARLAWVLAESRHGDPDQAARFGRGFLGEIVAAGDRWTASWLIHYIMLAQTYSLARRREAGGSVPAAGEAAEAVEIARLQGGLATLHRSLGVAPERVTVVAWEIGRAVEVATSVLGEVAYRAAAAQGEALRPELDELQRFALGELTLPEPSAPTPSALPRSRWDLLSPAEAEVALLAVAGLPNSAIAEHRGSSVRTVDAQVLGIRRKLLAANRSEIAGHVPAGVVTPRLP